MSSMIEPLTPPDSPTVGRIVHYGYPVRAAVVTEVLDDSGRVNLSVFDSDGSTSGVPGVGYSSRPAAGAWSWPQRGRRSTV